MNNQSIDVVYAQIVIINNERYHYTDHINTNDISIGDQIGITEGLVDKKEIPKGNLVSNFLSVGTPIYSVSNEDYYVFQISESNYGVLYKVN